MQIHPIPATFDMDGCAELVGRIVLNFHSLETCLRMFLNSASGKKRDPEHNVYEAEVGAKMPVDEFTDYSQLRSLIKRYNEIATQDGRVELDATLVGIRDAFAHGRVTLTEPDCVPYLVKFSRPAKDEGDEEFVYVEFGALLTPDLLESFRHRIREALLSVAEHNAHRWP